MVGDMTYGIGNIIPHRLMDEALRDAVAAFKRQALHAIKLGLVHPTTDEFMEWQIDLPEDMRELLEAMRHEESPEGDASAFDFSVDENGLYIGDDDDDWDDDFDEEELLTNGE